MPRQKKLPSQRNSSAKSTKVSTSTRKGKARTPPCPAYEEWSTARYFGFLRSSLRAAYSKWPPKYLTLNEAARPYVGPDKRRKKEYQCAICKQWKGSKDVSVDHIIPVGSLTKFDDLPGFCERLFCSKDKLRCLCNECHHVVTQEQRQANKETNDDT